MRSIINWITLFMSGIGGHCYVTLIKTDILVIASDQLVYEIQSISLTLMISTKAQCAWAENDH